MCTVTVVLHARGVRVMCNRDEQRTRPAALPPTAHDLGARRAVFPVDPSGGGTWIGVNDAGLVVTLLNAHAAPLMARADLRQSRGLIVRDLLARGSLPEMVDALSRIDARAFAPFRLVLVHRRTVVAASPSGGSALRWSSSTFRQPLLFTSSSLGDARVEAPRRRLFERMVVQTKEGWLDGQSRFHRHQWRRRPDISVRMERDAALTVSRTTVDVGPGGQRMTYEAPFSGQPPGEVQRWCSWL